MAYTSDGDIVTAARADTGWVAPEKLTADSWPSRNPHIAFGAGSLHVVWEDSRFGHPEVFTRRRDASGWSAEECLTCDLAPSSNPVIASDLDHVFVAWQEESLAVNHIRGRFFDGTWGPVEIVSLGPLDASEPTVSALEYSGYFVAWTDRRHGAPEIYQRSWNPFQGGWEPEQRLTQLGDCGRPSIHAEYCCGDVIAPTWLVAFERDLGVAETFFAGPDDSPTALSSMDGIPSFSPNIYGFAFMLVFAFGGPAPRYFVTWTDGPGLGPQRHQLAYVGYGGEELTNQGLSISAVGAIEGNPNAAVMAMWVEDRLGVPALVARVGRLPGAVGVDGHGPGAKLQLAVSPNPCRGSAIVGLRLSEQADVSLSIVDGAGRSIRDWVWREAGPGDWNIAWDARDAGGRRVPPGLYFAAARVGNDRLTRPIVVLR